MTHYKMPKQPIDDVKSDEWGLAALKSVGASVRDVGGNIRLYDLINMKTHRAHRMAILDVSVSKSPVPISGSILASGYTYFNTLRIANFPDFDDKASSVISASLGLYSGSIVTIYDTSGIHTPFSKRLAQVSSSGRDIAIPETPSLSEGKTEILYSDGRPVQDPEYRLEPPTAEDPDNPFQVTTNADDSLVIHIRGDILFDFDKAWLHWQAEETLGKVWFFINARPEYGRIRIEGHTDNKEKIPGYNVDLSRRRAKTVEDYFGKNPLDKPRKFERNGLGAAKPVAPNTKPDGSDNPEGREKNRRVEIYLYRR